MRKHASATNAPAQNGRKTFWHRKYWQLHLLALIPVVYLFIFHYVPLAGVVIAFKDYSVRKGVWGSPWAGFKYFAQLFNTPVFPTILKNTVTLSLANLLCSFPFPIILALAFNELRNAKLKKTLQTISFAPYFLSNVIIVEIISVLFAYNGGIINDVLNLIGKEAVNFEGLQSFFKPAFIISGIWQGAGYGSVLYIAALSSVDTDLYEAAEMDGATRLQRVRYVDLPTLAPTIVINLILNVGGIMGIGFEKVYLLQNVANYNVSEIIATYVYKMGIQQAQFSFSTAVGLFNAVVNAILLLTVNWIAGRIGETSLF